MLNEQRKRPYRFGAFYFDPAQHVLRRDNVEVPLKSKAFELLAILVERAGQVVEKEELMSLLWPDSFVEDNNLTVHKAALVKVLGEGYIQTVPRRGYRFVASVERVEPIVEADRATASNATMQFGAAASPVPPQSEEAGGGINFHVVEPEAEPANAVQRSSRRLSRSMMMLGAITVICLAAGFFVWWRAATAREQAHGARVQVHSPSDEAEIKRVVKESQVFEFLTLEIDPASADEKLLAKYWVPAEQGGKEIQSVKTSIKKLMNKGWHYGQESRVELFEFRYVRIFSPKDYAEAGTPERWYLPMHRTDGSRIEDRNVYYGVYDIDYSLRKINGAWLIEEASTPRSGK